MDRHIADIPMADLIRANWRWPLEQTGLVRLAWSQWMVDFVIERMDKTNAVIATALRHEGDRFTNCLTEQGLADPKFASRMIVSRITRAGVWEQDRLLWASAPPGWTTRLKRGPNCCEWAYASDGGSIPATVEPKLPVPQCDKFCGCRAMTLPNKLPTQRTPTPSKRSTGMVGALVRGIIKGLR